MSFAANKMTLKAIREAIYQGSQAPAVLPPSDCDPASSSWLHVASEPVRYAAAEFLSSAFRRPAAGSPASEPVRLSIFAAMHTVQPNLRQACEGPRAPDMLDWLTLNCLATWFVWCNLAVTS